MHAEYVPFFLKILDTMLDVEKPLIFPTLQEIDESLREAENGSRTWSGEGLEKAFNSGLFCIK